MGKIIVITGASTGIGAETARLLAEGNDIFVHYNASIQAAEQTAAEIQDRGGTAHLVQADLGSEAGCDVLYTAVSVMTNRLDVLVNNACRAAHVARTIQFLIDNDFLTGETVDVNGGLFMR